MVNNRHKRFWALALLTVVLIALGVISKANQRPTYRVLNPLVAVDVTNITWDRSARAYRLDIPQMPPTLWSSWPLSDGQSPIRKTSGGYHRRVILYEDGKRLKEIAFQAEPDDADQVNGRGGYDTLFFLTRDGSDPRENGRHYTIAHPWTWAGGNRSAGNAFLLAAACLTFLLLRTIPFVCRMVANTLTAMADGYAWLLRIGEIHHPVIVALSILYPLAIALVLGLSQGEFVTKTEEVALHRTADFQAPVLHALNNTLETLPPLYQRIARVSGNVFHAFMLKTLVYTGMDFYLALAVIIALLRAVSVWAWLPWFAWLRLPWWFVVPFAPLHLLIKMYWGQIYPYHPRMVFCGQTSASFFLLAAGLALLGRTKTAIVVWLLQAWIHPATFASWSVLFLSLILLARGAFDETPDGRRWLTGRRLTAAVCAALALLPIAGAWAGALAEKWGFIRLEGGKHYWDFVTSRSAHSLFGGVLDHRAYIPATYLLLVAGLFLLSTKLTPLDKRLRLVNRFFACTGLAFYCIYVSLVETHLSILANIPLPLRFEAVFLPVYILNLLTLIFRPEDTGETPSRSTWAQMAVRLLAFMLLYPILTRAGGGYSSILYLYPFLAHAVLVTDQLLRPCGRWKDTLQAVAPSLALTASACVATIIMLHVQTRSSEMFHQHLPRIFSLPYPFTYDGLLFCVLGATLLAAANKRGVMKPRAGYACLSVLLLALLGIGALKAVSKIDGKSARREASLVLSGVRAGTIDSPWNRFRQWHGDQVGPDDGILNEPTLLLCLVGVPGTSINIDILGFSLYAPEMADPLARDVKELFDVDIGELAAKGQVIDFDWERVKDRFLHDGVPNAATIFHRDSGRYRWLVEGSEKPARDKDADRLVFANEVVRVYGIP